MKLSTLIALTMVCVGLAGVGSAQSEITATTGPAELIETGGAGASFTMTEAEYQKLAVQLAKNPAFVPMTRKPDGLSPQARFGLNFVFERKNRTWALDGDEQTGYTFWVDLNGNGDLSDETPRKFEMVDGKPVLRYALSAKADDGSGLDTYPVTFKLVLDMIPPPGQKDTKLALMRYGNTTRRGELAIAGKPLAFRIAGSGGTYNEEYNRISFDLNRDGAFSSTVESYLISERYVNIGETTYEFAVDRYGRTVTLTPLATRRPDRVVLLPGFPAPDFSFTDLEGKAHKLSDYRGKAVLLNFWGTWCGPCVAATPGLVETYAKYSGRFEIIGIDSGDTRDKLQAFLTDKKVSWPQTMESDKGPIATLYRVVGWPTYFLVGPDGTIAAAAPDNAKLDLPGELAKLLKSGSGS